MASDLNAQKDLITQLYCDHHFHEDEIQRYLQAEKGVISESVKMIFMPPISFPPYPSLKLHSWPPCEKSTFTIRSCLEKWKLIPSFSPKNSYLEIQEDTAADESDRRGETYTIEYYHEENYYESSYQPSNTELTPLERFRCEEQPYERLALGLPSISTER